MALWKQKVKQMIISVYRFDGSDLGDIVCVNTRYIILMQISGVKLNDNILYWMWVEGKTCYLINENTYKILQKKIDRLEGKSEAKW